MPEKKAKGANDVDCALEHSVGGKVIAKNKTEQGQWLVDTQSPKQVRRSMMAGRSSMGDYELQKILDCQCHCGGKMA
jgi:hypothetical protein